MCNVNQHISGFKFKQFSCRLGVYIFIYINIDIHVLKKDLGNKLKDLT